MLAVSTLLIAVSISAVFADSTRQPARDHSLQTPVNRLLRIMPLGDSITEGQSVPGSYRVELAALLAADQRPFTFVGSQSNGPADLEQRAHEGHPGWCLEKCENNLRDHLTEWLKPAQPDIVLLDAGTNDLLTGSSRPEAAEHLEHVVDDIYQTVPSAHLYIAQIRNGGAFNKGVAEVVSRANSSGRFAAVVNLDDSGGFTETDYIDGIHPNVEGADKMGRAWYAVMRVDGF